MNLQVHAKRRAHRNHTYLRSVELQALLDQRSTGTRTELLEKPGFLGALTGIGRVGYNFRLFSDRQYAFDELVVDGIVTPKLLRPRPILVDPTESSVGARRSPPLFGRDGGAVGQLARWARHGVWE